MNLKSRIDQLESVALRPVIVGPFSGAGPWGDFWRAFALRQGDVTNEVLGGFASPFQQPTDRAAAELALWREEQTVRRIISAAGLNMEAFDRWIDEVAMADIWRCEPPDLPPPPTAPEGGWASLRDALVARCRDAASAWSYEDPRARWTFTYVFWMIVAEGADCNLRGGSMSLKARIERLESSRTRSRDRPRRQSSSKIRPAGSSSVVRRSTGKRWKDSPGPGAPSSCSS